MWLTNPRKLHNRTEVSLNSIYICNIYLSIALELFKDASL